MIIRNQSVILVVIVSLLLVFLLVIRSQNGVEFTGEGHPRIDEITVPESTVFDRMEIWFEKATDGVNE